MNPGLSIIGSILLVLQLSLPRRWAFFPALFAACHTPPYSLVGEFTVVQLIITLGLFRSISGGFFQFSTNNPLDLLMIVWSIIALVSSIGHHSIYNNPWVFRIGLILNVLGTYLYGRAYLSSRNSLSDFACSLVIVLVPFAILMAFEQTTGNNPYKAIGARLGESLIREGRIRAKGPFSTPILSGTVGASSIPFFIAIWQLNRKIAYVGIASGITITLASTSSGPIATLAMGLGFVFLWRWQQHLSLLIKFVIVTGVILHFIKERPIWYLMATIDIVGGSTGWHRASLIDAAFEDLGSWWFCGTDYTADWMPYSLPSVPGHCDLTNYYIHLGVIAGMPLVLCLLLILRKSFQILGTSIKSISNYTEIERFGFWCIGSVIMAHAITFLSISYFDQILVLFWILIGGLKGFVSERNDENTLIDYSTKLESA